MKAALKPLAALAAAAGLLALLLLALGASPWWTGAALWDGAFGSPLAATETLVKATPLLFCGLAVAIAFEASLWNIGADGQLVMGALAAGAIGPLIGSWPHPAAVAAMLAAGACGGLLCGGLCGWLRARRDVNEVISTIMLNVVAAQTLSWAVHGPLIEPSHAYPESTAIANAAALRVYFEPSRLNLGMALGVAMAIATYLLLFHTSIGFQLRALGRNRRAAAFFGLPIGGLTIGAMALSGAIAGIGGAVQISAITHRLYETFSPGWGYEAIAVALLARLNPLALIGTAILFGALDNGAQAMQRAQGVSPVLVQVIEAMVIMVLLAFDALSAAGFRATPSPREIAPPAPAAAKASDA